MACLLRSVIVGCCCLMAVLQGSGLAHALSMDEIISNAANNSENFAFFQGSEDKPTIRVELDMVFTPDQWATIQKDLGVYGDEPGREKRKAIRSSTYRWPRGVIPYELAPGVFTSSQTQQINAAIQEWETYTCLKFQRAGYSTRDKIRFDNGGGCFSNVGKVGGAQTVGLAPGCRYKGVVVHEIGHAVGFQHEQTRPDRDNHVQIIRQNIPSHLYYNFQKYSRSTVNDHEIPYDYRSIMHYGPKAFSVNGGLTIKTRDPKYQNVIGNRQGMSFRDIKLANFMYKCNDGCSNKNTKCPGEGFLDKNCRCMCPGNPLQECSDVSTDRTTSGVRTTTTTSGPVVESKCQDQHQSCATWARRGECSKNEAYMLTYCKKSCNICEDNKSCKDMGKHCAYWERKGYCRYKYVTYMRSNCAKSCNTCDRVDSEVQESDDDDSGNEGAGNGNSGVTSLPGTVGLVVAVVLCAALL